MSQQLKDRTKAFAEALIHLGSERPRSATAETIWTQLLRSGLSVGANYRSACCARSRAEFVAKLHIAREEADETQYWIELMQESVKDLDLSALLKEAQELTAILTVSISTAKRNSAASYTR